MNQIVLILGGNVGNLARNFFLARIKVGYRVGYILKTSSIHRSAADGYESIHEYWNQVLVVKTKLSPMELLKCTQGIEKELGRVEKSINGEYKDRTIDIDILYYANEFINEPELTIPHPRIKERAFVLNPLKELEILPTTL